MKILLCLFFFLLVSKWAFSEIHLVSTGPGVLRPRDHLWLVCKVTGFSIQTQNYVWHWFRQPSGKPLEWIAGIHPYDGYKWYSPSMKDRSSISSDSSKNEFYFQLNSVLVADSAVYFCSREYGTGAFDIWGKGTSVVVTTESPKAPSLFPLIPSGSNTDTTDFTIGCLAKNFLPDSIAFSWNDTNHQSIGSQNYVKYPSILSGGTYTTVSQAKVSRSAWDSYKTFYCQAVHPKGSPTISVVRKKGEYQKDPEMLIRAPILKAFSSSYLNSTVTCEISELCSPNIELRWLKENEVITTGITTSPPISNNHGGYTIWSKLVITKEDWLSQKKFTCDMKSKGFNRSETFSVLSFGRDTSGECLDVAVETIPPNFADMFLTSSANLTCRISNIPPGSEYSKLNVTWTRASDHKQLPTVMTNFLDQVNDFYYVDAIATVCATEWNEKETYICKVTFEDVLVKPVEKTLKKEIDGEPKAPAVYVLSPSMEELNLREKVSLVCLINNFNPGNFFVRWLQNGQPVSESAYFTSKAVEKSKILSKEYFASSTLTVNEQEWSAGDSFTCVVGHEALPLNSIQKTVNKNTGKPSIVNVSLVLSDASSPCY